jgi:hypothetical protein
MTTTSRMPSTRSGRIVLLLLIANVTVWAVFWGSFFAESTAYPQVPTPSEGVAAAQVVAHRAADHDLTPNRDIYYRVSFIPNLPSFLVTRVLFNIPTQGYRSPVLHFGTTVSGFELIFWMVLSFLQWYLVGKVIAWLLDRRRKDVSHDS